MSHDNRPPGRTAGRFYSKYTISDMPIIVVLFIITVVLISFGFAALAIKWDHQFKLNRERIRTEGGGNSLGASELKGLIQEAMVETISPIEERLELIEKHMRQLPEHASDISTEEPPQSDEAEDRYTYRPG